ncbi:MAG: hypothetical protein FWC95_07420 [Defluviitaleaceae bacterium]|nr:hypothetical protein [Defluviitaleaceae bacterium]
MAFWTAAMVVGIVAITWYAIWRIVVRSLAFYEDIERMKNGYPLKNGDTPMHIRDGKVATHDFVDLTNKPAAERLQ